jgi:LuxR family maltose regulon positive regulatory protein
MPTPLLTTKLYPPPPRPDAVARPRLFERLDDGLHGRLTLVSAPAGFGKTTLVSAWIEREERPAAWLSLDEGDGEPIRFLRYLVAALRSVAEVGEGVLAALDAPQQAPIERLLTDLLNEVAALDDPLILVLDDLHTVAHPAVHEALAFLVEHLPPTLHLAITTREDPPLPLARLRARNQVTEVRSADLRFRPDEAAEFLAQAAGATLSSEQVAALDERTEGWIAGLQMAALSLRGRDDADAFLDAFAGSHRFVLDYLLEEVLQQQADDIVAFLLRTSILERLSGPLCDAVTGGSVGAATLEGLERSNLFLIPLDDERRWYRYHHLFADVLRARASERLTESVAELHRRASTWFEREGLHAEAIRHALAADDTTRAADLIELAWRTMDTNYENATWLVWAKQLPEPVIRSRPVVCAALGWALLGGGRMLEAKPYLALAERWIDPEAEPPSADPMVVVAEDEFRILPATLANAHAYRALARGDLDSIVDHARRALAHLDDDDGARRSVPAAMLALAMLSRGELEEAHRAITEAMTALLESGDVTGMISATIILADIRMVQGRLRDADATYRRSLQLAEARIDRVPAGTADLHMGLSTVELERNDVGGAARRIAVGRALGERARIAGYGHRWRMAEVRLRETEGDLDGALALLDEAERAYFPTPVPLMWPFGAQRARLWLAQGRVTDALGWAQAAGLDVDDTPTFLREFEHLTYARTLLADHRRNGKQRPARAALALLGRLLEAAERGERYGRALAILLQIALAHQTLGELEPALGALRRALTLAAPEGFVRTFLDEGAPMAALLRVAADDQAAEATEARRHAERLLAAFGGEERRREEGAAAARAIDGDALVEPLSRRELEVLRLLAEGLTNNEIAAQLYRSLSTVKGHNRNLFGKLGVRNRTGAVKRAQELGLL